MDPKEKFYRHFRDGVEALQDQIGQLVHLSSIGGERQDATDNILAGISKLQNEVADAAEFTPAYDRRQYSDAIKGLQDKLNETLAEFAPKTRFQFRRTGTDHVDMGAPENDPRLNPGSLSRRPRSPTTAPGAATSMAEENRDILGDLRSSGKNYNEELAKPDLSSIRKPSFSAAQSIDISDHNGLHIILPSSASRATAAGCLRDLKNCVIDLSIPTAQGAPFPGLILKDIDRCLIVAGRVNGPIHINDVTNSILVVVARQVRIHNCKNVDIYLHCASHPIIEDCSGMRFAPLPECYVRDDHRPTLFFWDQVDDFKWLKTSQSPNWTTISEAQRLSDEVWTKIVPGQPGIGVEKVLAKVGIPPK
ncbi:TBCC-domain-containing protein [Trichoderma longibrachiatum ATCC 18648]|uniref:TBCC-domain-containing protein n=1 Tax=Trichoderma longibrachiatum ATCC 18648 TaxID=983965 RepID=A0A2T4C7G5_TRILO|nr:TBCC-domain-containing protein [Trichoderma longibrachiatum ATCC 18648]